MLDTKAYAVKTFFNIWGRLGSSVLNYGHARDMDVIRNLRYGDAAAQRLDIFRPRSAGPGPLPVLIYFHGGGWISADKKIYDGVAAKLSRNGFIACNVNYRLAPGSRFPAPLSDAVLAIDWIDRHLNQYGGDRSHIVLAGDSAGAQIASWYACALHKEGLFASLGIDDSVNRVPVRGLLLFYGVYDFDTVLDARFPFIRLYARSFLGTDSATYSQNTKLASPIRHVTPGLPPVFVCAGERDGLYSQSTDFAAALESKGVSCQKLFFPIACRAGHGFLFFRWLYASKLAFSEAGDFLRGLAPPT